jgi:hypothetical protein
VQGVGCSCVGASMRRRVDRGVLLYQASDEQMMVQRLQHWLSRSLVHQRQPAKHLGLAGWLAGKALCHCPAQCYSYLPGITSHQEVLLLGCVGCVQVPEQLIHLLGAPAVGALVGRDVEFEVAAIKELEQGHLYQGHRHAAYGRSINSDNSHLEQCALIAPAAHLVLETNIRPSHRLCCESPAIANRGGEALLQRIRVVPRGMQPASAPVGPQGSRVLEQGVERCSVG